MAQRRGSRSRSGLGAIEWRPSRLWRSFACSLRIQGQCGWRDSGSDGHRRSLRRRRYRHQWRQRSRCDHRLVQREGHWADALDRSRCRCGTRLGWCVSRGVRPRIVVGRNLASRIALRRGAHVSDHRDRPGSSVADRARTKTGAVLPVGTARVSAARAHRTRAVLSRYRGLARSGGRAPGASHDRGARSACGRSGFAAVSADGGLRALVAATGGDILTLFAAWRSQLL